MKNVLCVNDSHIECSFYIVPVCAMFNYFMSLWRNVLFSIHIFFTHNSIPCGWFNPIESIQDIFIIFVYWEYRNSIYFEHPVCDLNRHTPLYLCAPLKLQ